MKIILALALSLSSVGAYAISTASTEIVDPDWYKSGSSSSVVTEVFQGSTVSFTLQSEEPYIYADFQRRCPSGYSPSGSICKKTITVPVSESCILGDPPHTGCSVSPSTSNFVDGCGWVLSGCGAGHGGASGSYHFKVPKTKSCPTGYSISGKVCQKIYTANFEKYCPSGYHQYDGRCRKRK